jgi:hypothetical protein
MEILKTHLIKLNLDDKTAYCYNGMDALDEAIDKIDTVF